MGTLVFILFFSHTVTARGLHRLWALLSVINHDALAFTPRSPYLHHPLHSIIIATPLSYLLARGNNKSTRWDVFILFTFNSSFNSRPVDYPGNSTSQPASGPGGFISYFKLQLSSGGLQPRQLIFMVVINPVQLSSGGLQPRQFIFTVVLSPVQLSSDGPQPQQFILVSIQSLSSLFLLFFISIHSLPFLLSTILFIQSHTITFSYHHAIHQTFSRIQSLLSSNNNFSSSTSFIPVSPSPRLCQHLTFVNLSLSSTSSLQLVNTYPNPTSSTSLINVSSTSSLLINVLSNSQREREIDNIPKSQNRRICMVHHVQ